MLLCEVFPPSEIRVLSRILDRWPKQLPRREERLPDQLAQSRIGALGGAQNLGGVSRSGMLPGWGHTDGEFPDLSDVAWLRLDYIVSRSARALWKMALASICRADRARALDEQWDPIRCAVLGHKFSGYLLSGQFMAIRTGRLDLAVDIEHPQRPLAVHFRYGGIDLALPLLPGAQIPRGEIDDNGWEVQRMSERSPDVVRLQLDPKD